MTGSHTRPPALFWKCAAGLALAAIVAVMGSTPAWAGIDQTRRPARADRADHQRKMVDHRARSQTGAPYRSGGSSPSGFDCSGYTRWIFEGHGANLPHSAAAQFNLGSRPGYKRVWNRQKLKVGDLVFFNTNGYNVSHAGMYVGHGRFISSTSSSGVRVDSIYDPYYWGHRYVGATRLPVFINHGKPRHHHTHHHHKPRPSWHRGKRGWRQ
ncbi:MAG: putative lipoprotein NlpC [Actinomycetota bacterium]|nr:putative lipoprotein NlpC [Actinomycetota bacterium]